MRIARSRALPQCDCWLRLLAWLILGFGATTPTQAVEIGDAQTQQLLVAAVEAAADVDMYHARCRGDVSGRRMENLNKLLASRIRITVLTVEDDFFPERSYRRVQERLDQTFSATLRDAGGCAGAKKAGLPERMKARYDATLDAIRALP